MLRNRKTFLNGALASILWISFCAASSLGQQPTQKTFATPQDAVRELFGAVKTNDTAQLMQVLGPNAREVVYSGDEVADKNTREQFLRKYNEMNRLTAAPNGEVTLYIGAENWPFPITLVRKQTDWFFDTDNGVREILYRRIGRNEFATVDSLHALVSAQKEFASEPRDGGTVRQYAQKLLSDEGKRDGLYWQSTANEKDSPIGPLIATAAAEGYRRGEGPTPFHGYIFRLLTQQGPNATGGATNYIVDGKLTKGFGILAYPAEYRNSGVMTFIVNANGRVYQKDLGANTEQIVRGMTAYNPDKSWRFVE